MESIPDSVLMDYFCQLDTLDLCALALTCKHLGRICRDEKLWKMKFERNFGSLDESLQQNVESDYYDMFRLTMEKKAFVLEFQLYHMEDLPTSDFDGVQTRLVLLTQEHLDGLISVVYNYMKYYHHNLKREIDFRFRRIGSRDEKDREDRKWKQRAIQEEEESGNCRRIFRM